MNILTHPLYGISTLTAGVISILLSIRVFTCTTNLRAFLTYNISIIIFIGNTLFQELIATGAGNIFGSFFSCYPIAASVSRSSVQDSAGGKTQVMITTVDKYYQYFL